MMLFPAPPLRRALAVTTCLLLASGACSAQLQLEFIGEAVLPTGQQFEGTEIGGLSGIDYDRANEVYYVLSDDRSSINDARFYTLTIDLSDGALADGDIAFQGVVTLLDTNGLPFAPSGVDPEAIRHDPATGSLYWTSEGDATVLQAPFVREMNPDGSFVRELETPAKYLPAEDGLGGIRNNLAFESLTFSARRTQLVTATENALAQDGPSATTANGSASRFLVLDVATGEAQAEFIYETDPVAAESDPPGEFTTNGLVELLSLGGGNRFLAVERSFSVGIGNAIKLYLVSIRRADDVSELDSIEGEDVQVAAKTLLLDLGDLGITLDNIEGVTFGPRLANGDRSLILVSDNNFNPDQFTQFLAFGLSAGE